MGSTYGTQEIHGYRWRSARDGGDALVGAFNEQVMRKRQGVCCRVDPV